MNIKKKTIGVIGVVALGVFSYFMMKLTPEVKDTGSLSQNTLKVGVTAGPHAIIMEKVKELAAQQNLKIDIVEFNDFIMPNEALHHGEIDANVYQHKPFLNQQVETRKYKIAAVGNAVLMPLGVYSKKYKKVADIPNHSTITIPNDPTNGGRALLLLQKAGLIKVSNNHMPTIMDIIDNPKHFKLVEMDAPQLPRTLEDVAAAVINTDWVVVAKLNPNTIIFKEDKNSPYMNVIATHDEKKKDSRIQRFKEIYHSKPVRDFIEETFKGLLITGEE